MRVSVLETDTFESQSQLSRQRLRLSEVSLRFKTETETGKLLMVETMNNFQDRDHSRQAPGCRDRGRDSR